MKIKVFSLVKREFISTWRPFNLHSLMFTQDCHSPHSSWNVRWWVGYKMWMWFHNNMMHARRQSRQYVSMSMWDVSLVRVLRSCINKFLPSLWVEHGTWATTVLYLNKLIISLKCTTAPSSVQCVIFHWLACLWSYPLLFYLFYLLQINKVQVLFTWNDF